MNAAKHATKANSPPRIYFSATNSGIKDNFEKMVCWGFWSKIEEKRNTQ
jgi:hypothetical protein